jgi:hypothetical protein
MASNELPEGDGRRTTQDTDGDEVFHDTNPADTDFSPMLSGAEWREMHILIEITYKGKEEAEKSPEKHLSILHEMYESFPKKELIIYDNFGAKVNREACKNWTDMEAYKETFNIHDGYGRHIVIFRIRTTQ